MSPTPSDLPTTGSYPAPDIFSWFLLNSDDLPNDPSSLNSPSISTATSISTSSKATKLTSISTALTSDNPTSFFNGSTLIPLKQSSSLIETNEYAPSMDATLNSNPSQGIHEYNGLPSSSARINSVVYSGISPTPTGTASSTPLTHEPPATRTATKPAMGMEMGISNGATEYPNLPASHLPYAPNQEQATGLIEPLNMYTQLIQTNKPPNTGANPNSNGTPSTLYMQPPSFPLHLLNKQEGAYAIDKQHTVLKEEGRLNGNFHHSTESSEDEFDMYGDGGSDSDKENDKNNDSDKENNDKMKNAHKEVRRSYQYRTNEYTVPLVQSGQSSQCGQSAARKKTNSTSGLNGSFPGSMSYDKGNPLSYSDVMTELSHSQSNNLETGEMSSSIGDGTLGVELEHEIRKKRLERNRECARECRRRKREKINSVEERCHFLTQENMELRAQLRASKEKRKQEEQEKLNVCLELEQMIQQNAKDEEIAKIIYNFEKKYSDYGHARRSALRYHLDQLERLLLPTQVTKMCMWSLQQDDSFWLSEDEDDSTLSCILSKEIGIAIEQKKQIKSHRGSILKTCENINDALVLLNELKEQVEKKNLRLDEEMEKLQGVLSPSQRAKFIVWVTNNPACKHLLNELWFDKKNDSTSLLQPSSTNND